MSDVRPFFDATDIAADGDAVRSRLDRDGYLFVRGLLAAAGGRGPAPAVRHGAAGCRLDRRRRPGRTIKPPS